MIFTAIDLETTGLTPAAPYHHRVVEIGIVKFSVTDGVLDEFETLINAERDIGSTEVHGLSATDLARAPTFFQITHDLAEFLNGSVIVAHNQRFDLMFLAAEFQRAEVPYQNLDALCTLELMRLHYPRVQRRLQSCCEHLGLPTGVSHSAIEDARMCARLACHILLDKGFPALPNPVSIIVPQSIPVTRVTRTSVVRVADTQGQYLRNLLDQLPVQPVDPERLGLVVAQYLNLLEQTLEDRRLSREESDGLVQLAADLGLPRSQVEVIHASFFIRLAQHALRDGLISDSENRDLTAVADLLGIGDWQELVNRTDGSALRSQVQTFRPGSSVCFTGQMRFPRGECEELARMAGLVVRDRVTRDLDLLVIADPDSQSGKAVKARAYGTRLIAEEPFFQMIGVSERSPDSNCDLDLKTKDSELVAENIEESSRTYRVEVQGHDLEHWEAENRIWDAVESDAGRIDQMLGAIPARSLSPKELHDARDRLWKFSESPIALVGRSPTALSDVRGALIDLNAHCQFLLTPGVAISARAHRVIPLVSRNIRHAFTASIICQDTSPSSVANLEMWPDVLRKLFHRVLKDVRDQSDVLRESEFIRAELEVDEGEVGFINRLAGLSIVVSGVFSDFTPEEARQAIMRRGGRSPYNVSTRTAALVVGQSPSDKILQKALHLRIPLLDAAGFREVLDSGLGQSTEADQIEPELDPEETAEKLTCSSCGQIFSRQVARGRKPSRCYACR